jgi:hypothetical protein
MNRWMHEGKWGDNSFGGDLIKHLHRKQKTESLDKYFQTVTSVFS